MVSKQVNRYGLIINLFRFLCALVKFKFSFYAKIFKYTHTYMHMYIGHRYIVMEHDMLA